MLCKVCELVFRILIFNLNRNKASNFLDVQVSLFEESEAVIASG